MILVDSFPQVFSSVNSVSLCWKTWMQEGSDGFDKDEIDCAIAISLSDVNQKGKKVIGRAASLKH